jgi:hypothetical protein
MLLSTHSCPLAPSPAQLKGSTAVEKANERFDATMCNVVRWADAPAGGGKQIVSDTFIQVGAAGWVGAECRKVFDC